MDSPCKVIGRWWDASIEHWHRRKRPDDEFLKSWAEGLTHDLPKEPIRQDSMCGFDHRALIREWEDILATISLLERKEPGFAHLPAIRHWLDHCVFHEGRLGRHHMFSYADVKGDWSHLKARPSKTPDAKQPVILRSEGARTKIQAGVPGPTRVMLYPNPSGSYLQKPRTSNHSSLEHEGAE